MTYNGGLVANTHQLLWHKSDRVSWLKLISKFNDHTEVNSHMETSEPRCTGYMWLCTKRSSFIYYHVHVAFGAWLTGLNKSSLTFSIYTDTSPDPRVGQPFETAILVKSLHQVLLHTISPVKCFSVNFRILHFSLITILIFVQQKTFCSYTATAKHFHHSYIQ